MRFALYILLLLSCSTPRPTTETGTPTAYTFYLGTYDEPGTHKPGIYRFRLQPDGMLQNLGRVATADSPSFLSYTADRRGLLAVEESGSVGSLAYFRVDETGELQFVNRHPTSAAGPCHVNINAAGFATVATYGGGTLELFQLTDADTLSPVLDVKSHRRRGALEPHAHSSYFLDDGQTILAADLGTNEIWQYRLQMNPARLLPASAPTLKLADKAGPRHLAIHPNEQWIYVINELNSTVSHLNYVEGELSLNASLSTLPADYNGTNFCADIHVSSDGRFLYGSNRGHNSIVVFSIDQNTGALSPLAYEPTAGNWPRNLALSPDERFLLVANQRSKTITTLARNPQTGLLTFVSSTRAPIPVCILF